MRKAGVAAGVLGPLSILYGAGEGNSRRSLGLKQKGVNMEDLGFRVDALEAALRQLQTDKANAERSRRGWRLGCAAIVLGAATLLFPWAGTAQDAARETQAQSLKRRIARLEGAVATLQQGLITEVSARTVGDASTLASAKAYTDTKSTDILASAKAYTDTKSASTLASAKSYTDTKSASTLAAAKAYTDQEVAGEVGDRAAAHASLQAQITPLTFVLAPVSRVGAELVISGANLHIVNGSGATETTNGLGNLIVGYNELKGDGTDARGGSHSVIVGLGNNYASYGGLVVGSNNSITGKWASVCAGFGNTASGDWSSVSGGSGNVASGRHASVSGGTLNTALAPWGAISGGGGNSATGDKATVSGGQFNEARGFHATVSGGQNRIALGVFDWVAGSLFQDF